MSEESSRKLSEKVFCVKVQQRDVPRLWDSLKPAILNALPPFAREQELTASNALQALLAGTLQAWVIYKWDEERKPDWYAVATTMVDMDMITGSRNLLLYSLYGLKPVTDRIWLEALDVLRRYKDSMLCEHLTAYSNQPEVIKRCEILGGNSEWRLLQLI